MKFISYLAQSFFAIPLQDFSEKLSTAIGIAKSINKNSNMATKFDATDLERLEFILEKTNKKYQIALAKLDLYVDPTKGRDITRYEHLISIKSDYLTDDDGDKKKFKLTRYDIQKLLFDAVTEVLGIVNNYFLNYNDELDFGMGDDTGESTKLDFGKNEKSKNNRTTK